MDIRRISLKTEIQRLIDFLIMSCIKIGRQAVKQTDRQAVKQTDRQAVKQTDRQIY